MTTALEAIVAFFRVIKASIVRRAAKDLQAGDAELAKAQANADEIDKLSAGVVK